MKRYAYTQISEEAIGPRVSVLGYVKVGGLSDKPYFTSDGKPWYPPVRYATPARFQVTTREQKMEKLTGKPGSAKANETFTIAHGYVTDQRLEKKLREVLPDGGQQLDEIDIRFMFPTMEENFLCHFGAHSGKKWVCTGNGVEAQDITRGTVPCPCPRLKQFTGSYDGPPPPEIAARGIKSLVPCKPRGVLSFIIPAAETFGGFHAFKTTSYESIANLRTQLSVFQQQFGRVDGLPFKLKVYAATKSYGDGEGTTTQPIVTLVIAASFETARQIAADAAEKSRTLLLAAGGAPSQAAVRAALEEELDESVEAEGQEFHPEAGKEEPGPSIEEKLKAKGKGKELPVVVAMPAAKVELQQPEPDFEPADDGEPETPAEIVPPGEPWPDDAQPVAQQPAAKPEETQLPCREGLEQHHKIYEEAIKTHQPAWTAADIAAFQAEQVGKPDTATWDVVDYDLAVAFLRRGVKKEKPAPAPKGGRRSQGDLL